MPYGQLPCGQLERNQPCGVPEVDSPGRDAAATEATAAELSAMTMALELAQNSGVRRGPNPAVGCVILNDAGQVLATGYHRGPGTPHAEATALATAGARARGATAVVTLEPCAHHGRTPPCADALIAAGVTRVVFGQTDPNPEAAGGADRLRAAGVAVLGGIEATRAAALNPVWSQAARLGRPVVTWKVAASLDGRIAAADGTSKWITGAAAREQVHALRASVDAVLTGTGTALADNPALTARPGGQPITEQPLRAVMGYTHLPAEYLLAAGAPGVLWLATHDPHVALSTLWRADVRHVLLESGPRLAGAFLAHDLVDYLVWFTAPIILGAAGTPVCVEGPATLADARGWRITATRTVAPDVRIDAERERG